MAGGGRLPVDVEEAVDGCRRPVLVIPGSLFGFQCVKANFNRLASSMYALFVVLLVGK